MIACYLLVPNRNLTKETRTLSGETTVIQVYEVHCRRGAHRNDTAAYVCLHVVYGPSSYIDKSCDM